MTTTEIRNRIILLKGINPQPIEVKMEIQKLQQVYDEKLLQSNKNK
jgi:hypothetical protein|tara:strand:- start:5642 stop:5779 length:138 start_codon:yes stop_codon:yes gene_type:complete